MRKIHHVCIQTEKYQDSLDFYTRILGFKINKETTNFHGRDYNTWLELDGFFIELQTPKKNKKLREWHSENSGIVHLCFSVEEVKKEYERIKELGYTDFKKKNGIEELYLVEDSYLFKVKAPEGTEIEFRDKDIEY